MILMIELATLSRPYAEAVFKRAQETQTADSWSDMLSFIAIVMRDKKLSLAAEDPKVAQDDFTGFLLDVCEGHVNDEGCNFIKLLIQNNRLKLIQHISQAFEKLKAESEGYIDASVKTAFPLSDKDVEKLAGTLEKTLNKKVRLHIEEDKALIGGVLIRAGDRVIDGSIRGQLQQLAKRFSS